MANLNGFSEDKPIDEASPLSKDIPYFAIVTSVNYVFGEYILPNTGWSDFYVRTRLGYFHLENGNISANFWGGF